MTAPPAAQPSISALLGQPTSNQSLQVLSSPSGDSPILNAGQEDFPTITDTAPPFGGFNFDPINLKGDTRQGLIAAWQDLFGQSKAALGSMDPGSGSDQLLSTQLAAYRPVTSQLSKIQQAAKGTGIDLGQLLGPDYQSYVNAVGGFDPNAVRNKLQQGGADQPIWRPPGPPALLTPPPPAAPPPPPVAPPAAPPPPADPGLPSSMFTPEQQAELQRVLGLSFNPFDTTTRQSDEGFPLGGDKAGFSLDPLVAALIGSSGGSLQNILGPQLNAYLGNLLQNPSEGVYGQLPFNEQIQQLIGSLGGGTDGASMPTELQSFIDVLGPGFLFNPKTQMPFTGGTDSNLEGSMQGNLAQRLFSQGTNPFGPGLTPQEMEAQSNLLSIPLERERSRGMEQILGDAARRGLTSADAPAQEQMARLNEYMADQSLQLSQNQLLEDTRLRRASGEMGLQRDALLNELMGGAQNLALSGQLGGGDLLSRLLGMQISAPLQQGQLAGDILGQERGLQAQQLNELMRLAMGQQFGAQQGGQSLMDMFFATDAMREKMRLESRKMWGALTGDVLGAATSFIPKGGEGGED